MVGFAAAGAVVAVAAAAAPPEAVGPDGGVVADGAEVGALVGAHAATIVLRLAILAAFRKSRREIFFIEFSFDYCER